MISIDQALALILSKAHDFGFEEVELHNSLHRILAEDIHADRDFPPFDRVTMDGIAIRYAAFDLGRRSFEVCGIAPAGAPKVKLENAAGCIEVMTGAVMPEGADTVIRYEDVNIENGSATISVDQLRFKQNIHFQGEDRIKGSLLIKSGVEISSAEIGVCATVGKSTLKVLKLPKVLVISSGDELVEVTEVPLPHQIRKSNIGSLRALLQDFDIHAESAHLNDDFDEIKRLVAGYLDTYDIILMSGAVSKGKFDFLPKVLEELGVEKHFHKVKQRPGKPFWFGTYQKTAVFAFPGNPVSTFVCAAYYLRSFLQASFGLSTNWPVAQLAEEVVFKPEMGYFLEVKIQQSETGESLAVPVKGNGSGDLANLLEADGFILLAEGKTTYSKGEVHPVIPFR
jgi:molybdopterin molybdotransferase